jgi:hypothetical protein
MTALPETKYTCDRCGDTANMTVQNVPAHDRIGGPQGWLALRIGLDPATPPAHLCPPCAFGFKAYIDNRATITAEPADTLAKRVADLL